MRRATVVLVFLAALLVPGAAQAGGWASVSLDPMPKNLDAGDRWDVSLTILQHGRTPLTGVEPAVFLRTPAGREQRFAAVATSKPGVYRASVLFRRAGTYTYRVDDGFTNAFPVKYPPVIVGAKRTAATAAAPASPPSQPSPPSDDGFPWQLYLISIGVLAAIGAGIGLTVRPRAGARAL